MRLSIRPGRVKAGSNKSIRLVAPIINVPAFVLKPSNATSNSFNVLSLSADEVSLSEPLFLPRASISSIKIIHGIFFSAN